MPAAAQKPLGGIIHGVETFEPGQYPGDNEGEVWTFTDKDVAAVEKNFQLLSAGPSPKHRPPVKRTHDQVYAHGWVTAARRNPETGRLLTDWSGVQDGLREEVRSGRLKKVSAEIKHDFRDNDGTVYPGPYLYAVSVIGADVPRVKGLQDLPVNQFADAQPAQRATRVFKFADPGVPVMDRAAAITYLQSMGIDPATITDAVPDDFLIAVATAWQADESDDPNEPAMLTDPETKGRPKKVTMTQQFSDRDLSRRVNSAVTMAVTKALTPALKQIESAGAKHLKAAEDREVEERVQQVQKFCDRMAAEKRIDPADNESDQPGNLRGRMTLLARQPQAVQKFTDPATKKETSKTLLQLEQEAVERRPAMKFAEKGRQMAPGEQQKDPFRERLENDYKRDRERRGNGAARN